MMQWLPVMRNGLANDISTVRFPEHDLMRVVQAAGELVFAYDGIVESDASLPENEVCVVLSIPGRGEIRRVFPRQRTECIRAQSGNCVQYCGYRVGRFNISVLMLRPKTTVSTEANTMAPTWEI